jgi:hypothetical protein
MSARQAVAQWLQAICGCRDLFGEWGAELLRFNWQPDANATSRAGSNQGRRKNATAAVVFQRARRREKKSREACVVRLNDLGTQRVAGFGCGLTGRIRFIYSYIRFIYSEIHSRKIPLGCLEVAIEF